MNKENTIKERLSIGAQIAVLLVTLAGGLIGSRGCEFDPNGFNCVMGEGSGRQNVGVFEYVNPVTDYRSVKAWHTHNDKSIVAGVTPGELYFRQEIPGRVAQEVTFSR